MRTRFFNVIKNIQNYESDLDLRAKIEKNANKFVTIPTSSTFKSSINEILVNPVALKMLGDTQAFKESAKLEEFFKTLDQCPNKVVYGEKEVNFALEENAVKDLLISDNLLRSTNFRLRKKFIQWVEKAENQGCQIFKFNVEHPTG